MGRYELGVNAGVWPGLFLLRRGIIWCVPKLSVWSTKDKTLPTQHRSMRRPTMIYGPSLPRMTVPSLVRPVA